MTKNSAALYDFYLKCGVLRVQAKEMLSVAFKESKILFDQYSYPAASIFPSGEVSCSQIAEINSTASPPEIRLHKESLFVTAVARSTLVDWCSRNGIADVPRVDIWGLLLEPFLDTEFSIEDAERTSRLLQANGLTDEEARQIREEVRECMYRYNTESGLWDWYHLGLSDVLDARLGRLAGERCKLKEDEFRDFYWRAMELALRGKPVG